MHVDKNKSHFLTH